MYASVCCIVQTIDPVDESVVRCLVLRNTEFGIDVVLHTMVVSVQMVRSDIHQYGDIGTEVIHIVQLERAEFDDIIVMMLFGYLQSQTLADISGQSYIQICTLKDVVDQGSSRCLSVRASFTASAISSSGVRSSFRFCPVTTPLYSPLASPT